MLIGFLQPFTGGVTIGALVARGVTAFAVELMPCITRAQSMDALSAMSTVAGYKAVVLAASLLSRFFPRLMTAAGTQRVETTTHTVPLTVTLFFG